MLEELHWLARTLICRAGHHLWFRLDPSVYGEAWACTWCGETRIGPGDLAGQSSESAGDASRRAA